MVTGHDPGAARPLEAPSLVQLAVQTLRKMILAGALAPGDRLLEERLTRELAISRPPLREAMRVLENEGLIVTVPRKGASVAKLTRADVYEVLTLRSILERAAFELAIPITDKHALDAPRAALEAMEAAAEGEDRGALVQAGYDFHSALVDIAGHRRLSEIYRSVQQQALLCMSRNLIARERYYESLNEHVQRHRELLDVIATGTLDQVLESLATHGERSFDRHMSTVLGETAQLDREADEVEHG